MRLSGTAAGRSAVALGLGLALAACSTPVDGPGSQASPSSPPTAPGPQDPAAPSPADASPVPSPTPLAPGGFTLEDLDEEVTPADLALVERLVAFALAPTTADAARLGLAADGVQLGLGPTLHTVLAPADAAEPAAWDLPSEGFRAHDGALSAVGLLAGRVGGTDRAPALPDGGLLQVQVGEHPHCAAGPVPAPEGLTTLRRVSVQPADAAITSCLDWFTVDLFVDDAGTVHAITLDVWEP